MRGLLAASVLPVLLGVGAPRGLTRAEAREDLRHLHAALRELHPGLHRYSTPAEIDAAFAEAEAALPDSVAPRDFFRTVASLSGVIRDGHTRFRLPAALEAEASGWPLLPLRIQVSRGRLFVVGSCRERDEPPLAGREILAVDDVPAADLIRRLTALHPRDGSSEAYPRWALDRPLAFNDALNVLLGPRDAHQLTLASGRVRVPTAPRAELSRCGAPATRAAALRFESDGIAVLTVPTLEPDLTAEYQEWFGALERRRTRGLLIDLRDNGGGLDRNGSRLFAHLTRAPFRYYDAIVVNTLRPAPPFDGFAELLRPWRIEADAVGRLQFTGHECLGPQRPEPPTFDGPVVVLINGGTFSAASEFAAVAAAHRRARFVGEETGGAANGNTAGVSAPVVLPHSGIRVRVPMMRYEVAAPGLPFGRGVRPDLEWDATVDDLRAGRDVVAEQALALVRRLVQGEDR